MDAAVTMNERERARLLQALRSIGVERSALAVREYAMMAAARAVGATWKQIAEAIGVESPQGAEKRFRTLRDHTDAPPSQPCQVCGGSCGIVCEKEAQAKAGAEFDQRVADSLKRLDLYADDAGHIHVHMRVERDP
jgi:hypothetical protein